MTVVHLVDKLTNAICNNITEPAFGVYHDGNYSDFSQMPGSAGRRAMDNSAVRQVVKQLRAPNNSTKPGRVLALYNELPYRWVGEVNWGHIPSVYSCVFICLCMAE